jgi:hypothetical protein
MAIRSIQLKLKLDKPVYFEQLLDDFTEDKSPILPICVTLCSDVWLEFGQSVREYPHHYNIYEVDDLEGNSLASIRIKSYPSLVLVSIDEIVDDSLNKVSQDGIIRRNDDWEKVKQAVREIVKRAQEMEIEIISTDPPGFIPKINNRVSNNPVILGKWKRVWNHMRIWREGGMSYRKISEMLERDSVFRNLPHDRNTLSKIEKAAKAGMFEDK